MSHRRFQDPDILSPIVGDNNMVTNPWEQWLLQLTNIQTQWSIVKAIINPASVAANTTVEQATTITQVIDANGSTKTLGATDRVLEVGDIVVMIIKPTLTAGLFVAQGRVTADNQVTITYGNVTGSAIDATQETYTLIVLKG